MTALTTQLMKSHLCRTLALLALLALFTGFSSTLLGDEVSLKTTQVSDNIYMISGVNGFAGGNVAVSIGIDGILVIDSLVNGRTGQLEASLADIVKGRKGKGRKHSNDKMRYLLNTHWHGDHTGGNAKLSKKVPIIAHDNVRKYLQHDQHNYFGPSPAAPKEAWPVMTFNDQMTLYFNQDTIVLQHYPSGHTDGDAMIYFADAKVLHMGDHYFKGIFPFVDLTTGGNVVGMAKNIEKAIAKMPADVVIIPGHGDIANLTDLKGYSAMLNTSIERVSQEIADGLSLAQIQQKGLGKDMARWGKGFIPEKDWIEFTYLSIKRQGQQHSHKMGVTHHH